MDNIGNRLKTLREAKKMSQADLAKALGKSQVAISKYENGNRQLDYDMLKKYSKFFNVSADYLLGRVDSPNELYISTEDYPDVLKALIIGGKSYITVKARTDDFSKEPTSDEKKKAVENTLKEININDCIDELSKSNNPELLKQFTSLISFLPEKLKSNKDRLSLYEYLKYTEESEAFKEAVKNNASYDDRGELIFNAENRIKPNEKSVTSNDVNVLDRLMLSLGYHIEKVKNSFSFVGKHGGYMVTESEIMQLKSQIMDYVEYSCEKFEKKIIDADKDNPMRMRVSDSKKP